MTTPQIAREFEQQSRTEGTGPMRVFVFRNQNNPEEHYTLALFEDEERAREAERNPKQADLIRCYWDVYEGPPEYADLTAFLDWSR